MGHVNFANGLKDMGLCGHAFAVRLLEYRCVRWVWPQTETPFLQLKNGVESKPDFSL